MEALTEWGRNRFKPMVMLAQVTAPSAERCHELVLKSRGASLLAKFGSQGTDRQRWLDLYRHRDWLEGVMLQFVYDSEAPVEVSAARELAHNVRESLKTGLRDGFTRLLTGKVTEREVRVGNRVMERMYRQEHLPMVMAMLEDNEPVPANAREWLAMPEVLFFLTVAAPCWLEYHVTAWTLYRQACRGKQDALEKLLRLDPDADKDDRVGSRIFDLRRQRPEAYELLQRARLEGRTGKITLADMKFLLGGLLMKWSTEMQAILQGDLTFQILEEHTALEARAELRRSLRVHRERAKRHAPKCRLTAGDIKSLFDAVAKDRAGELVDRDFSQQPHAIYKRLKRNSGVWPSLRKMDKTRTV